MYGSYHRISALAADGRALENAARGSRRWSPPCESGDVFTQQEGEETRALPAVIPSATPRIARYRRAYGASMSRITNTPALPEVLFDNGTGAADPAVVRPLKSC